jgi:hypothetical protein
LIGLYNFGKQCGEDNDFTDEAVDDANAHISYKQTETLATVGNKWMDKKRDDLIDFMWKDYQEYIQAN